MSVRSKTDGRSRLLTLTAILLLSAAPACDGEKLLFPIHVTPRQTSVLLLPALDTTPDAAHMLPARSAVVRHREEYELITRQFKVLGEAMAAKAADNGPHIKLDDLSERTPANMDLLAKRADADWVVSVVVQNQRGDSDAGRRPFTVSTLVLLQIWDARHHGWLANGPYTGEDTAGGSPVFVFKYSLDNAVKVSLANLLGSYPPVVSVDGELGMRDYLAGQKQPFVGDPKTPFSGLKATP
jgi:hypothetical protein